MAISTLGVRVVASEQGLGRWAIRCALAVPSAWSWLRRFVAWARAAARATTMTRRLRAREARRRCRPVAVASYLDPEASRVRAGPHKLRARAEAAAWSHRAAAAARLARGACKAERAASPYPTVVCWEAAE